MTLPARKNIRLPYFDYRSNEAYFVTICTKNRKCVFGSIEADALQPSQRGLIAAICWRAIPAHHPYVELDHFVIMPNHVHGILRFAGATYMPPASQPKRSRSLGAVIGTFKAAVTREINQLRPNAADSLWQRSFYDHIIRNDRAYQAIWQYIDDNPRRWLEDEENPVADRPVNMVSWLETISADAGDIYVAPTKDMTPAT